MREEKFLTADVFNPKFFLEESTGQVELLWPIAVHVPGDRNDTVVPPLTLAHKVFSHGSLTKISLVSNSFHIIRLLSITKLFLVGKFSSIGSLFNVNAQERMAFDSHRLSLNVTRLLDFLRKSDRLVVSHSFIGSIRWFWTSGSWRHHTLFFKRFPFDERWLLHLQGVFLLVPKNTFCVLGLK